MTGDGRSFFGSDNGKNSVLEINYGGAKTSGNLLSLTDASANQMVIDPSTVYTSRPQMGIGSNNNGSALYFDSPTNNTLTIKGNRIGINVSVPGYPLDVSGDIHASGNVIAGSTTLTSDIRLKNNVQRLNNSLTKLTQLSGYSYNWKDKSKQAKQIGVIAQEVEKVFPEAVLTDKDGFKSVAYSNLIAPVIESIKDLLKRINSSEQNLNREIASLKKENAKKGDEIEAMKSYICSKDKKAPFCK